MSPGNPIASAALRLIFSLALLTAGCGTVSLKMPAAEPAPAEDSTQESDASQGRLQPPSSASRSDEAVIESALRELQTKQHRYTIGPADLLQITVYKEGDLDRTVRVSPDGVITLPLAGKIRVGGLDVPAAEEFLQEKLKKFLVNPQISVFIKEYGNKMIYVMGEVQKPGSITIPTEARLTVLEAITLAGGFTPFAAKDRTRVIRKTGGKSESFKIEVSAITRGDKSLDMDLQPNDVIVVPESIF